MSSATAVTAAVEINVLKSAIGSHQVVHRDLGPISDGQALFAVDRFAITANNVTYAVFGDAMKYWNFFPASDPQWGVVPVWGFGDVMESRCDGVEVGDRYYGYWPMASHAVLEPARVTPTGFFDGIEHRRELHSVYNNYVRVGSDPSYDPAREAEQMLLRPLFTTSFLIDDFLADNQMFGAHTVVLSSASSKTAYGAAFCLHERGSVRVVGLTSQRNRTFTEQLGCYDQVLCYDEVAVLPQEPTTYVDMSGSSVTRSAIHEHLGDNLNYDCVVGGTHWDEIGGSSALPGPRPEMFFAPAQVAKRNTDWGQAVFQQRLGTSWTGFLDAVVSTDSPWMRVEHVDGAEETAACFVAQAQGVALPEVGYVAQVS